ncbi:hypothetical protein ALT721_2410046 [Alteromonas alvinellae]
MSFNKVGGDTVCLLSVDWQAPSKLQNSSKKTSRVFILRHLF